VAISDLQQQAEHVLQLAAALATVWSSKQVTAAAEELIQLWQVHTWLLDFQLAGGQGLKDALSKQQLQQCQTA
jgi:hypothetical protein